MALFPLLRPLVFRLDPERAHGLTIAALNVAPRKTPRLSPTLRTEVAGLSFPSPVGLAAGFDKHAEVTAAMLGLGFGFVEVGTITPKPQPGNPRPRLFRLAEDRAVINRFGFNSHGQDEALARLARRGRGAGIVGVNLGANKHSADRIADYAEGVRRMAPVADYLTINISSPNTPGLRQLQDEGELRALLSAVREARTADGPPVFLKLAPDLGESEPRQIVRAAIEHGIDGLIVSNTTVSRPPLRSRYGHETGGLSGAPLKALALDALRRFRSETGGALPLIGAGGIGSAEDAWERIRAGASLVQLYSAMVYEGPGIARRIARGLERLLEQSSYASIAEAVGASA
ncbi:quinone-dependent dihydroorotate dehydrogenase [Sphingomonas sp. BN140010]|uniref:Dihydroorotate dehydrogenase (quinone) n=1 Tax=Sphingomonas arvum TaxID=2992113 RepID=A0ABT3JFL1_9SPHN|nr:quinone-dependent dihydroorotate dehydrogenase [Sphingomonas sp. BN140010]MCW3797867.1 quinone-dependent dihydroorotate dehydrogenase [Sphingomonas sp. BN140010]